MSAAWAVAAVVQAHIIAGLALVLRQACRDRDDAYRRCDEASVREGVAVDLVAAWHSGRRVGLTVEPCDDDQRRKAMWS